MGRIIFFFAALAAAALGMGRGHALLIGIDEYGDADGITRLAGAERDVAGLASALEQAVGIPKGNIEVLAGRKATRLGIIQALDRLRERSKPGDLVFFSFSGHGFQPGDKVYLVPFDAVAGSEAVLQNSSLEATEVSRLLGQVDSDLMVAVYDMCRNDPRAARSIGQNSMSFAMERDLRIVPSSSGKGPKRVARLFASSQGQRAWESPTKKRGYFSWFMEQGLRGQAARNGVVTMSSLMEYLEGEVLLAVDRERKAEQRPEVKIDGSQVLAFILARQVVDPPIGGSEFDRLLKEAMSILGGRFLHQISWEESATAEELLVRADRLNPASAVVKLQLGRCFHKRENMVLAEAMYRKAIELDPRNSMAHANLGALLFDHKKDIVGAEAMYRKAIELDPRNSAAHNNLGALLANHRKDIAGAEAMYRKAIDLNPRDSVAHLVLGALLANHRKDIAGAEAMYRKAIELDPRNSAAHNNLGALLEVHRKDIMGAEAMYRKAIDLDPRNSMAHVNLGRLLEVHKKDIMGAEAMYRKAIDLDPRDSAAQNNLGALLKVHKKDIIGAEAMFRKAIDLDPRNSMAHYNLGVLLMNHREDIVGAEAMFRKAIELDPQSHHPKASLGDLLFFSKNQAPEAERLFREALSLAPSYDYAYARFHEMLKRLGRTADAQKLREQAEGNGVMITP